MSWGSAKSWSSVSASSSSGSSSESPQWPPPYIRATIKCSGPYETAERDLILYPDDIGIGPLAPTYYSGYAAVGYAYASVHFQLGPATSIITPHVVALHGQDTGWYAVNGDAYEIPNTAFAFFNTNWKYQTPTAAEIRLILAYP